MVPKANSVYMSVFIILLLFSSKVALARVSRSSETKEKTGTEFQKMKNINLAKKIEEPHHAFQEHHGFVPRGGDAIP